jgi:hypothetical protein
MMPILGQWLQKSKQCFPIRQRQSRESFESLCSKAQAKNTKKSLKAAEGFFTVAYRWADSRPLDTPEHSQTKVCPSKVITLVLLFALEGVLQ